MIVKEVLEILHSNGIDVTEEDFIYRLENLDVEDATLDTDLKDDVLDRSFKLGLGKSFFNKFTQQFDHDKPHDENDDRRYDLPARGRPEVDDLF